MLTAAGALWLSGCVSPYWGCVMPGQTRETSGPPAAWVQRNVPISPAPVEYDRRFGMAPPVMELQQQPVMDLQQSPVMELQAPSQSAQPEPAWLPTPGDAQPFHVPPGPEAQAFPPLAPAAETPPVPGSNAAASAAAATQAKIDGLSAQIADLDRRLQDQSQALEAARHESATAQQLTQQLQSEFVTWRSELTLVRDAIRAQGSADLQVLDELNTTLEQLLPVPAAPEPQPPTADEPQMATGRRQQGTAR